MDKLSIVVPVYNSESTIKRCLDSFESSDMVEIVIVNDGSTDNSGKVIENYVERSPHVFKLYNHEKNMGVGVARTTGIEKSSNDWIAFCDSDDEVRINELLSLFEKVKNNDLMIGEGRVGVTIPQIPFCFYSTKFGERVVDTHKEKSAICVLNAPFWSKVFNKQILENLDTIGNMNEDVEVVPYLFALANNVYNTNEVTYIHHSRKDSLAAGGFDVTTSASIINTFLPLKKLERRFEEAGLYSMYKDEIDALYIKFFSQRIKDIRISTVISNKEELISIILEILTYLVPNWGDNKYYKSEFKGFELIDKGILMASKMKPIEGHVQSLEDINALVKRYDEKKILKR